MRRASGPVLIREEARVRTGKAALMIVGSWMLSACAAEPVFPPNVEKSVDPAMQFGIFNAEADTYLKGQMVLLGGRIVSAEAKGGKLVFVAQELPVQDRPFRRPIDTVKPIGDFVFTYQGLVDQTGLQPANKFLLVGEMRGTETIVVDGADKAVPHLIARCLHVWKTGQYAIRDFPDLPDGYYPLAEETYCIAPNP